MTIAVDLVRKATQQTNKKTNKQNEAKSPQGQEDTFYSNVMGSCNTKNIISWPHLIQGLGKIILTYTSITLRMNSE